MVYAAWGSLAGFGTEQLRLLSLILAGATIILFGASLTFWTITGWLRWLVVLLLLLNPYFVGMSVFVLTDVLALLGLALVMYAAGAKRPWLAAIGLAVATMTRQYLAFLAPAIAISALLARGESPTIRVRRCAAAAAGMLPFGAMVLLWNGHITPSNSLRDVYLSGGLRFDLHALSLYLAMPGVYLLPLIGLVLVSSGRRWLALGAIGAVVATMVLIFPVQAAPPQTTAGIFTVGFAHRAFSAMGLPPFVGFVFWLAAATSIWALLVAWYRLGGKPTLSSGATMQDVFLWVAVGCFLLVMPFSYLPWEKYALPQLMLTAPLLARAIAR